ncbi:MAG: hypothetical protein ACTSRD_09720, partial [Promethearchaeota archaeon]
QNDTEFEYLDFFITPTPIVDNTHFTRISFHVNSTGGNSYYELNARENSFQNFQVYPDTDYNQFFIEFVTEKT